MVSPFNVSTLARIASETATPLLPCFFAIAIVTAEAPLAKGLSEPSSIG